MLKDLLLLFFCLLLQASLGRELAVLGAAPNFLVIGLIFTASKKGPVDSMIRCGLPLGLMQDFVSSGYFGMGLTLQAVNGFFAGLLIKQTYSDNYVSKAGIAALVTLIDGLASLILLNSYYGGLNLFTHFFLYTIPCALYTGLLMLGLLALGDVLKVVFGRTRKAYGF